MYLRLSCHIFLLILGVIFIQTTTVSYAQNNVIDSLEKELRKANNDSLAFDLCIDLHNAYFKVHPERSKQYAHKMLDIAKRNSNLPFTFKAYCALARCGRKMRDYKEIIAYDKKALDVAKQMQNPQVLFEAWYSLAKDYLDGEYYNKLEGALKQAAHYAGINNSNLQKAKVNYAYGFYFNITNRSLKAIPYFESCIKEFEAEQELFLAADCKVQLTEALLKVKPPQPYVLNNIKEALVFYEQKQNQYQQAYCRGLMGQYFVLQGNYETALENFKYARALYIEHHNKTEYALCGIDMANALMDRGLYKQAYSYIKESGNIIRENNYEPGIPLADMARVRYYMGTGDMNKAARLLSGISATGHGENSSNIKNQYEKLLAEQYFRQKNLRAKDSILFYYYKNGIVQSAHEPYALIREWSLLRKAVPGIDTNIGRMIELVQDKDGAGLLKSYFATGSFQGYILPDSILNNNVASSSTSAGVLLQYEQQLEALEAIANKKLLKAALEKQEQENKLNKARLAIAVIAALSSVLIIILLTAYLSLAKKRRREAEAARKKEETARREAEVARQEAEAARIEAEKRRAMVEALHVHINHLVYNNIKRVRSLVAALQEEADRESDLKTLRARISAIMKVHMYLKDSTDPEKLNENLSSNLEQYLTGIWEYLQTIYAKGEEIVMHIAASLEIESDIAVNVAMIVTELMTNTCKYAFSPHDENSKKIFIKAIKEEDNTLHLLYRDNGKGMSENAAKGKGMTLIAEIAKSLKADYTISNDNGLKFEMSFKPGQKSKAV